ncbi:MAG TPA: hypothetical protein VFQ77_17735 [Pseudonocardiaceae bacterium]|nr:hypothetical protein [Pseudonocardiaceae bacterium]
MAESIPLLKPAGREATGVARKNARVSRSTCANCGRTDRLGFADETVRQGRYDVAVVIVCRCQRMIVSKVMQGLVRPGMRRGHFSKQRDRDRRLVVSQLALEDIHALYATARGSQTDARSKCWRTLVPQIVRLGVVELTIERMEGGEARDRRDIREALVAMGRASDLTYTHKDPAGEPMLWVADAVAWCAGAGRTWRARIDSILYR